MTRLTPEDENYVAWLVFVPVFVPRGNNAYAQTIKVCDSDTPGAFKVSRTSEINALRAENQLLARETTAMRGDYARLQIERDLTVKTQNAKMEECERGLYLQINALEAVIERLTSESEPPTPCVSLAPSDWTYKMLRQYVDDTCDGFDCLPLCDSYGHEEECPVTNHVAAWRLVCARKVALERRVAELETALRAFEAEISDRFAPGESGLQDMTTDLRTVVLQARSALQPKDPK